MTYTWDKLLVIKGALAWWWRDAQYYQHYDLSMLAYMIAVELWHKLDKKTAGVQREKVTMSLKKSEMLLLDMVLKDFAIAHTDEQGHLSLAPDQNSILLQTSAELDQLIKQ